jgi:hypothetical protein
MINPVIIEIIADSDEYLLMTNTTIQQAIIAVAIVGEIAKNDINVVAKPLPPLNLQKHEYICPKIPESKTRNTRS